MTAIQDSKVVRRLTLVMVAIVSVPASALAPVFLANHLIESATDLDNGVILLEPHPVEHRLMRVETVMPSPSINGPVITNQSWTNFNIIRNGVLVQEGFSRHGDLLGFPIEDNPLVRQLPTHAENCATVVSVLRDEAAELAPGWNLAYIEIIDEESSKLRRCPIP